MIQPKNNSIPFWNTIGRSFKYVFKNKSLLLGVFPLAIVLIIFQLALGLPFLCAFQNSCPMGLDSTEAIIAALLRGNIANWPHLLTVVGLILGAAGVIINYCRTLIVKAQVDFTSLKFWKRMGFYLIARILFDIVVLFIFILLTFVLVKLLSFINPSEYVYVAVVLLALLVAYILAAPIFLAFPAIAVDDFQFLHPKKLFIAAKGNFNAIFWGQVVIMTPYWVFFGMLKEIYSFLPQNIAFINFVFVSLLILLSIMDACFKGAFFAHIYQFFNTSDKFNKN